MCQQREADKSIVPILCTLMGFNLGLDRKILFFHARHSHESYRKNNMLSSEQSASLLKLGMDWILPFKGQGIWLCCKFSLWFISTKGPSHTTSTRSGWHFKKSLKDVENKNEFAIITLITAPMFKFLKIYLILLKGRVEERKREREKSVCWLTLQTPAAARAGPDWS